MTPTELTERVRGICLGFPESAERATHGAPGFFVKKQFVMLWPQGHHGRDEPHLWAAAAAGVQAEVVGDDPERFFVPPYVGGRGWVGMRLDGDVDWAEVAEICEDAYRQIAPPRLLSGLDR
ncbi:MmcQ/YjbR family DNA-binding protein [Nocardioides sp. NPDC047086]|uniref:MmcQ/YjbR family DNA-binding protein n=1 Tax=Nocardioides sp. NPDC047086 TaxID=3154810 RepID=UPI0033D70402